MPRPGRCFGSDQLIQSRSRALIAQYDGQTDTNLASFVASQIAGQQATLALTDQGANTNSLKGDARVALYVIAGSDSPVANYFAGRASQNPTLAAALGAVLEGAL